MSKASNSCTAPQKCPRVAIIGRPNVGKSSLFNKMIKKRKAIESYIAGTTRDRISEFVHESDMTYELIDTGGLQLNLNDTFDSDVRAQAKLAILEADLILFVISAIEEVTRDDFIVADLLRNSGKEVILVANKCDNPTIQSTAFNLYELGFGDPVFVSTAHSIGIDDVNHKVVEVLKLMGFLSTSVQSELLPSIALIGRPNVGKSSLFNCLSGEKRAIVSEVPGTTRDSIDTYVEHDGKKYLFKDTAGIRRRGKIEEDLECLSVMRSRSALESCDIVIAVFDYKEGVTKQDLHVISEALEAGKGIILLINKSDLMPKGDDARKTFLDYLQVKCGFLSFVPVVFTSALTGKNVGQVFSLIDKAVENRARRITTSDLNDFFSRVTSAYKPHGTKSFLPKILYVTQVGVNPPHFVVFVNRSDALHFSYRRYIENQLRQSFEFDGTVLKIEYRSRK